MVKVLLKGKTAFIRQGSLIGLEKDKPSKTEHILKYPQNYVPSSMKMKNKYINVRHTLCYFSKDGKCLFEMHDTKTVNGKRIIHLTAKAIMD